MKYAKDDYSGMKMDTKNGCKEMKVEMPKACCEPYSKDNAKEYKQDLAKQAAYVKKNHG